MQSTQDWLAARGLGALAERMGIEMVEFDRDHAVATMPVEGNTQPIGLVHGGAYVVLAESLGSMHANLLAPDGHVAVGLDLSASHTSSATEGQVTGTCVPIHIGKTIAVHHIDIHNDSGRLCSTIRITNFFKKLTLT